MLPFSVQERDVDLLLIELLHTSDAFVDWLAKRLDIADATFDEARHSVSTSLGETDVLAFLKTPSGRVAVMIEDKIGAPLQPRQRERYHERGEVLCSEGRAATFQVLLCAPSAYHSSLPRDEKWQHHLSFEEVAGWLLSNGTTQSKWKARILTEAHSKMARARQADDKGNVSFDPAIAQLKSDYFDVVGKEYHELVATVQTGRDREYYLKAKDLPGGVRLKHSFFKGEVSLIFERKWAEIILPDLSAAKPPGSEVHLRKPVEVMDPILSVQEQLSVVRDALDEVVILASFAKTLRGISTK